MNRTEARQLDCEIRECLENFSIEQGLNPKFGELIMDNEEWTGNIKNG